MTLRPGPGPVPGLRAGTAVRHLLLVVAALGFLVPAYLVLVTSLKSAEAVATTGVWALPPRPTLDPYRAALAVLGPGLRSSLVMTIPAVVLSSLVGSLAGYALARLRFRGADLIFSLILFGLFLPYQAILIPLVQFLGRIGLYDTYAGLILTHTAMGVPITTLMFRNFYSAIPKELVEAAAVDGASSLGIYGRIILPLSAGAFAVVGIWQFTSIWNDFLFGLTLTRGPAVRPVTVALAGLKGGFVAQWNVQMAGAVLTALPTLAVYVLLGRLFLKGLLAGALKG